MTKPRFHKELDTYLELRSSTPSRRKRKQNIVILYKQFLHQLRERLDDFKDSLKPTKKLMEDLVSWDGRDIHVFDREQGLVQRVKQRFKPPKQEQQPEEPEDVDVELVQKTISEGKLK